MASEVIPPHDSSTLLTFDFQATDTNSSTFSLKSILSLSSSDTSISIEVNSYISTLSPL